MLSLVLLLLILFLNLFLLWGIFGFFRGAVSGAPFVPSGNDMVEIMMQLAGDLKNKRVYDLGCGDGRIVFSAAKKGAIATGVEISFPIFLLARLLQRLKKSDAQIIHASLWDVDLRNADVVFLYLLPAMMKRFEQEKYPTLKKGCIIISHGFSVGEIIPDEVLQVGVGKRALKIVKKDACL